MAPSIHRLLHLARRAPAQDPSPAPVPAIDVDAMPLEGATLAAPLLEPAAIFRQVLFDPTEFTPTWLRPRPAPAPAPAPAAPDHVTAVTPVAAEDAVADVVTTDAAKPAKRTRRPKAADPAVGRRPTTRRARKTDPDPGVG